MTDGGITKLKVGDTVVVNNGKIISENTGGVERLLMDQLLMDQLLVEADRAQQPSFK